MAKIQNLNLTPKLVMILLIFGILPAIALFTVYEVGKETFEIAFRKSLQRSAATQEIARTTETVSEDARQVLESIAEMTRSSAQSSGKSIGILWLSEDLEGTIGDFGRNLEKFLNSARSV
jgi:hypothetical protein